MCACKHNHEYQEIQVIEQVDNHLHGITCSLSCNHEEHIRTGFSTTNYVNFSKESVYDQVDDGVKAYIDLQGTMF